MHLNLPLVAVYPIKSSYSQIQMVPPSFEYKLQLNYVKQLREEEGQKGPPNKHDAALHVLSCFAKNRAKRCMVS